MKRSRKQLSSVNVVIPGTIFFFSLASFSSSGKKTFQNNIIKTSSDKAWSLLCIIKQVEDILHSQRYDIALPSIYNASDTILKALFETWFCFPSRGPQERNDNFLKDILLLGARTICRTTFYTICLINTFLVIEVLITFITKLVRKGGDRCKCQRRWLLWVTSSTFTFNYWNHASFFLLVEWDNPIFSSSKNLENELLTYFPYSFLPLSSFSSC